MSTTVVGVSAAATYLALADLLERQIDELDPGALPPEGSLFATLRDCYGLGSERERSRASARMARESERRRLGEECRGDGAAVADESRALREVARVDVDRVCTGNGDDALTWASQ